MSFPTKQAALHRPNRYRYNGRQLFVQQPMAITRCTERDRANASRIPWNDVFGMKPFIARKASWEESADPMEVVRMCLLS
ncbi:hypothetical protein [Hydrogenophaga sp.]|uniref:hypothetical protein n=1 Tax=Hydrogenophaga sp. TaxID=1904254 RepID=UPI002609B113|nr:hypothetical protein [Hydrogenophaga sp.]MCW5654544.1 hypothetical protein [Hydrogenophaga sp.]